MTQVASHHRILIVDDNPAIHEDFHKILLGGPGINSALEATEALLFDESPTEPVPQRATFVLDSAFQGREALEMVKRSIAEGQPYAMAFVDVRMPPGWDGIETIAHLWAVAPALQVVVCTAYSDYSWDKMSAKLGVSDNLVLLKKPFDNVEVLQLSHALTKKWLVTQQAQLRLDQLERMVEDRTKQLEATMHDLRTSEERFSKAFHNSPIPQAIQTLRAHRFVDANDAFLRMTGFSREEVIGKTPLELHLCLDYEARFLSAVRNGHVVHEADATISSRGGELRQVLLSLEPMTLGAEAHVLLMAQDISDRLALETQLRQAQKMEAIGQLAAGVAHDFNNLLTVIQGHASLHFDRDRVPAELNSSLSQINSAAERAADLTRKLLTFSRRGMMRPKVLDLRETIHSLSRMLRRLLGERIMLHTEFGPDLPHIVADVTSVEQVLMNLTLNARDAMPEGGTITIRAEGVLLDEETAGKNLEARAGEFVCLRVTDTGVGMDEATRTRIFEPFFTTKGLNKGTGMGLATVYGIVKQHCGWIEVKTAPGAGSTFSVYLPATEEEIARDCTPSFSNESDDGQHTVLVVEDDPSVRGLVVEVLQNFQYTVIAAETGDEALRLWPSICNQVDVLLTDMVMPGSASGLDVARRCQADKPNLRIIFTSGYSNELFESNVKLVEGVNYLPKPYLSGKLTAIIRTALKANDAPAVL